MSTTTIKYNRAHALDVPHNLINDELLQSFSCNLFFW